MNVVMNYNKPTGMLQLALFPEKHDYFQDIQHIQGKMTSRDIGNIATMIEDACTLLDIAYQGYNPDDASEYWKEDVFKLSKWEEVTSKGYVFLEHRHRVIRLYMIGGCLTMNLETLEKLLKQLEKV